MGLGRSVTLLVALLVVFFLHVGSNIINRVILELFCHYDKDAKSISCSFLVLVLLFLMLSSRPCHFVCYCVALVAAELLLQLIYLAWFLKLHYLLVCDIIPFMERYWLGGVAVYKLVILFIILYVIWFHVLPMVEFKVNWGSSPDDCSCDSPPASKCDCPDPPSPCSASQASACTRRSSCRSSPDSSCSPCSPPAGGDC